MVKMSRAAKANAYAEVEAELQTAFEES